MRASTYEFGGGDTIQSITPAIMLFPSTDHLPSSDATLLILSERKVDIGQEMAGVTLCCQFENGQARLGHLRQSKKTDGWIDLRRDGWMDRQMDE